LRQSLDVVDAYATNPYLNCGLTVFMKTCRIDVFDAGAPGARPPPPKGGARR
jgi:hypothetical protein